MIRPILVVGHPVLRQKAKRISQIDRSTQKLIDDMIETMKAAPGVGLAAPQVGVPLRLAVIDVDGQLYIDRMETLDKLQRSEPLRKREADALLARREAGLDDEDEDEDESVDADASA